MIKPILALSGIALAYAGIAFADDTSPSAQTEVNTSTSQSPATMNDSQTVAPAGRRAQIDPETGELTSESQGQDLSLKTVRSDAELPPVELTTHNDGTVQALLNGRFRTPLMATIGCDGTITTEHSNEPLESNTQCEEDK